MKAIVDTSIVLATAPDIPDLTGFECAISSITYGELGFGTSVASNPHTRAARIARLHAIMATYGPGIPFDDLIASSYGYLFGVMHGAGKKSRTRFADIMIAATAHRLGVALITRNPADFEPIRSLVPIEHR